MATTTRQTTSRTPRSPRSPHTVHRDRQRCTGHKAQLLQVLIDAHPYAPALDDLRSITSRLSARIEELRSEGWAIETLPGENRVATYRLQSKTQGPPIQYAAAISIYVPVHGAPTVRTHEKIVGEYTSDLLAYAAEQAKRAYTRALGRSEAPPKVEANTDDSDFEGGVW